MNLKHTLYYLFVWKSCFSISLIVTVCFLNSINAQVLKEEASSNLESQIIEATKQELIGNPDKSIELLEKMRSNVETKATVYYQLARLYYSKSKLEDALNAINESILADPTNKWSILFQANIFESVGRYKNAASSYESLTKIEPESYAMYDLAAINYLKSEQTGKALEILDLAQKKFGPLPKICIQKSKLLEQTHKSTKALENLLLSLKEYPSNTDLLAELYYIYKSQANNLEANKIITKIAEINSSHQLLRNQKSNISSISTLESISEELNKNNINLDEIIKTLIPELSKITASNIGPILILSDKLILKFPKEPKVWAINGDIYYNNDQFFKALQAYRKAIDISTVPYSVWENYIISLMNLNHWKTLEEQLNIALDYYPNQGFLYYVLALAQLNNKKLQEANNLVQQFMLMSKNNSSKVQEANLLLAKILDAQGKISQSEEIWNKCLQYENNDIAIIEYCVNNSKKGKSFPMDKLIKANLNKNLQEAYKLSKNATIYYYSKDLIKAKMFITDCLNLSSGKSPENYELASQIYSGEGDLITAKEMLLKAIELTDDKPYFTNLINRLN